MFDIKIECMIEFKNNIQVDCGKILLSKIMNYVDYIRLFYDIPADNFINTTNLFDLKLIFIKIILPNHYKYFGADILFYNTIFTAYLPNELEWLSLYLNYMNTFIVEPTYYRRLTYFGRQCDPRVKTMFDDSLTDDCIIDCFQKRNIKEYNCIPFKRNFGFIRWKKDLIEKHKILCNQSFNQEIDKFIYECINECQFDCELGLYKITKFHNHNSNYGDNITPIKIIPRSNFIVQYEEVYIMDSWELIYQVGGGVGMWVGWSAVSIVSFLNNIFVVANNIKYNYKLKLLFKFFKYYFHKIKTITIQICILLNIYFRAFYRRYSP